MGKLKNCKTCNQPVSATAGKCPHCGQSNPGTSTKAMALTFLGLMAAIMFGLHTCGGDVKKLAEQTPEQRDGGTQEERAEMDIYCLPLMTKALSDAAVQNSYSIIDPTTSYLGKSADGGNVYLQEAVFQSGNNQHSWRCHRSHESQGWKDIEIKFSGF